MRKEINHKCRECGCSFITREVKSKYCGRSCSAKNANRKRGIISKEQRVKTSESLKRWWRDRPDRKDKGEEIANYGALSQKGKHKKPKSLLDVSKRTVSKICKRLNLCCSRCGWDKDVCDIHHIISRKDGGSDRHSNLSYLCPNCHRLAGNLKVPAKDLITLEEYIGDRWLNYYYG